MENLVQNLEEYIISLDGYELTEKIDCVIDYIGNYNIKLDFKVALELISINSLYNLVENRKYYKGERNLDNNSIFKLLILAYNEQNSESLNYINSYISKTKLPLLTASEEEELINKIKNGDQEARQKFIKSNFRLVVMLAKKLCSKSGNLDFLDIIEIGNLGLIDAVDNFDPHKKLRFSTYAVPCIKSTILLHIYENALPVYIPRNVYKQIFSYKQAAFDFKLKYGYNPSVAELAKILNVSESKILDFSLLQQAILSLDSKVDEDDTTSFYEIISNKEEGTDDLVFESMCSEQLMSILHECLNEGEIDVIKKLYFEQKSLKQVAKAYGVTVERIRQREANILRKLRIYAKTKQLAGFMDDEDKALENLEKFKEKYKEEKYSYKKYL